MNVQRISLDVGKAPALSQVVRIGQGDSAGTTIVATIYDNVGTVDLTDMTARFCMRLPGGTQYVRDSDCTVSGSTVTYVVDEEHCAAVKGRTDEAYFEILASGSVVYSTSRFTVHVLRGVTDGAVPGGPYDTAIDEAIARANEAAEAAEEAAGGVTPLMSANTLGGAKLGDGLALSGEALGVDALSETQIDSIVGDTSVTSPKVLNGTRLTYLWAKLKAAFAAISHTHTKSQITDFAHTHTKSDISDFSHTHYAPTEITGTLPVDHGGTGGAGANSARISLGVPAASSIAYVEENTATANHAAGSHIMLDGALRKVTSAIVAGESNSLSNSTNTTVDEMVSEAVSALQPVAMTATKANTKLSITNSDCFVADGVVFVNLTVKATDTVSAGGSNTGYVDLATIPEHPAANIAGPMLLWSGSSYVPTNFAVRTNGTVQVYRPAGMATNDVAYLSLFFKQ